MFLKVMHDGADEFLATVDSDATYCIYADVVSCHFKRWSEPSGEMAEAHIRCREPVKTGLVDGFHEIEKRVLLSGDAFLMNEQGRTISKFKLRGVHASDPKKGADVMEEQKILNILGQLPYEAAAAIRTTAKQAGSVSADYLIKLLDRAKVAMDA